MNPLLSVVELWNHNSQFVNSETNIQGCAIPNVALAREHRLCRPCLFCPGAWWAWNKSPLAGNRDFGFIIEKMRSSALWRVHFLEQCIIIQCFGCATLDGSIGRRLLLPVDSESSSCVTSPLIASDACRMVVMRQARAHDSPVIIQLMNILRLRPCRQPFYFGLLFFRYVFPRCPCWNLSCFAGVQM